MPIDFWKQRESSSSKDRHTGVTQKISFEPNRKQIENRKEKKKTKTFLQIHP